MHFYHQVSCWGRWGGARMGKDQLGDVLIRMRNDGSLGENDNTNSSQIP